MFKNNITKCGNFGISDGHKSRTLSYEDALEEIGKH